MNADKNFVPSPAQFPDTSMPVVPQTPLEMLGRALQSGATAETLERLLTLQERWERNEARKAYDEAIAQARAEIPKVLKTRTVSLGSGKGGYQYEDLAAIEQAAIEPLSAHGLRYFWRTDSNDPQRVVVTCVVSH